MAGESLVLSSSTGVISSPPYKRSSNEGEQKPESHYDKIVESSQTKQALHGVNLLELELNLRNACRLLDLSFTPLDLQTFECACV